MLFECNYYLRDTTLVYVAMSGWHLGEIASCQATIAEAISLAKELNDTNALAYALGWAPALAYFERNPAEVDRLASDLIGEVRYSRGWQK